MTKAREAISRCGGKSQAGEAFAPGDLPAPAFPMGALVCSPPREKRSFPAVCAPRSLRGRRNGCGISSSEVAELVESCSRGGPSCRSCPLALWPAQRRLWFGPSSLFRDRVVSMRGESGRGNRSRKAAGGSFRLRVLLGMKASLPWRPCAALGPSQPLQVRVPGIDPSERWGSRGATHLPLSERMAGRRADRVVRQIARLVVLSVWSVYACSSRGAGRERGQAQLEFL